jgi:thioredoxin:protein disulfide reductase
MKRTSSLLIFWLIAITPAFADAPKAALTLSPVGNLHWPALYSLTLGVPQDHHAYLDRGEENAYLPVKLDPAGKLAAMGLLIGNQKLPSGERDTEVKATVIRGVAEYHFELAQKPGVQVTAANVPLEVKYQLCNDATHVCFRPQIAQVDLPLPSVGSNAGAASSDGGLMGKIQSLFQNNQDNLPILIGLMFIAGLLSVATPCVYPILPITAMFITGRAEGTAVREKQHALAYLVGIVAAYTFLGLIAGMTGGAFNALMQSAWVNLAFAGFFAFFAISLLGFYELSFLQNEVYQLDQKSSQVKGIGGTFLMGGLAGLVISPCVGPIVFALLLHVADNIAQKAAMLAKAGQVLDFWGKLSVAAEGSLAMSAFGLGVGLPFFIVGIVKFQKLPKAGHWMNRVKSVFGLIILYFAYAYYEKGMGVLGADATATPALAAGLVILWIAVVHCNVLTLSPPNAAPNQKILHYLGVISVIIGSWLVVASLGRLPLTHSAQASMLAQNCGSLPFAATPVSSAAPVQQEAGISWYRSYEAAKKAARESGKPMFIDFFASWCANCVEFKKQTASNPELNQALRDKAIAVKLIDQEPDFEQFKADAAHRPLKIGLPYFAIINSDGQVVWTGTDYKATDTIIAELNRQS